MSKYLFIAFLLFFIPDNCLGQTVIGVINYVNVEDEELFLEEEQKWQKIHQQRIEQGKLIGRAVYQVMFKTPRDPYNYITISWYDSFSKLDNSVRFESFEAVFPGTTQSDWQEFKKNLKNSRNEVSSGVFHQRITCENPQNRIGNFYVINEINVKPGKSKEFMQLKEDVYKPLYDEDIRTNNRSNWGLWEKWPGNMRDFQYVTSEGYVSLEQMEAADFTIHFAKIHPDKDLDQLLDRIEELRTLVNTEMWKLVFVVME